ncbi:MAG: hypothetical protein H7Y42_19685 [Chitinophagaceae bacterium]|nr:hypothetical protein [Chitinophagaceae bacterium]
MRSLNNINSSPVYLFLLPIFFVLHGFTQNFHFVETKDAALLALKYLLCAAVVGAVFYLIFRDFSKAALMTFFIFLFLFFFGNIQDLLKEIAPESFLTKYIFLIPFFILVVIGVFIVIRRRRSFVRITGYLNILFLVLIPIDVVTLVSLSLRDKTGAGKQADAMFSNCENCPRPDVYIIMLDEYAGLDGLKNILGYDNKPFYDTLTARGFHTVVNSHSNYNYTLYSTASTLNMEYMDQEATRDTRRGYKYAVNKIEDNKAINYFRSKGYKFFNYSPFTMGRQSAPVVGSFVPTGTKLISSGTLFSRLEKDVLLNAANRFNMTSYLRKAMYITLHDNEKLFGLTMSKVAAGGTPKVVYTHLLMPHYPYYHSADGELRSFEVLRNSSLSDSAGYLGYLQHTNSRITTLIDHILSRSAQPPIIALMSDHGYRYYHSNDTKYYFSNLLSVHLPGKNYEAFGNSMSSVNFFRAIFNSEFRQTLPYLPDQRFIIDF